MKYFEIFKAGTYPQGNFTQSEVQELANNYDPSFCEAPITLDHIQSGPAFGWVDKLKEENGVLKASFKNLTDELKEYVSQGKYKKISVEIYKELEGKKPYLKAVSFLGASIPQVKGMKAVEFKEGESETFVFEAQVDDEPAENIEDLKAQINDLTKEIADFKSKSQKNEEIKILKSQVKKLNDDLKFFKNEAEGKSEIEQELKDIKERLRTRDFNEFIDKQIESGILIPANKDAVFNILCDLDNVKKFSESSDGIDKFKAFIESLPKQVEFKEVATKNKSKIEVEVDDDYADADEESLEIFKEAKALAKQDNISFRDALLKLKK